MEVYVNWSKMRPLTREHFDLLKVGDKVYYVNGHDELNTITYDKRYRSHINRVVYNAEIIQITKHMIVLKCTLITDSIHGWNVVNNVQPHIESFSKTDSCEYAKQWLYQQLEWEYVK